jgi:hypothetical protein
MLTEVELCERCARALWPALKLPSMQEEIHLSQVAAQLEQCKRCVSQVGKLRHAGNGRAWAWCSE